MRYITCEPLDQTGLVKTVCTMGNLVWRAENPACPEDVSPEDSLQVTRTYQELSEVMGVSPEQMVRPLQEHTDVVRVVSAPMGGQGVIEPASAGGCDGLITSEPGLMLCTLEADCLPVFLLDPVHKAVGMVHSGWRGSAACIAPKALRRMKRQYKTDPSEVLVHFGPSICGACYDVGAELIDQFASNFSEAEIAEFFALRRDFAEDEGKRAEKGAYLLDNACAVRLSLLRDGVLPEHMSRSEVCTFQSKDFASYRREHSPNARMLTGIVLLA